MFRCASDRQPARSASQACSQSGGAFVVDSCTASLKINSDSGTMKLCGEARGNGQRRPGFPRPGGEAAMMQNLGDDRCSCRSALVASRGCRSPNVMLVLLWFRRSVTILMSHRSDTSGSQRADGPSGGQRVRLHPHCHVGSDRSRNRGPPADRCSVDISFVGYFLRTCAGIGAFVGAVQTKSIRRSLALESGLAWLAVVAAAALQEGVTSFADHSPRCATDNVSGHHN